MSVSFSDLLCDEDSVTILTEQSPGCSSDHDYSIPKDALRQTEELLRRETDFFPYRLGCGPHLQSVTGSSAREESVAWIIKVHALYRFRPLTAYLSVNYMDRFLSSRCFPRSDGWPMQLLSLACLSLAAKMEEPLVPSLLDLQVLAVYHRWIQFLLDESDGVLRCSGFQQVEGVKYVFEPRTIRRMELLVLTVLDWRLRSVTPFCFLGFFAFKVDPSGAFVGFLVSHATEVILSIIQASSFLEYRPSSIATAAMLCAANNIPSLSPRNPGNAESWCSGLIKEEIAGCYRQMEALVLRKTKGKSPKVLPQFRVTTPAGTRCSDSSSSSCSSSPSSSQPYNKRRKLGMCLWVDDAEKGSSSEYEHEEEKE